MSERLERVIVATSRRQVEIPWDVRFTLLERLRHVPSGAGIAAKFEAIGATRPVILTADEEPVLHAVAQEWENELGADHTPPSILELRDALKDFSILYSRGAIELEWDSHNLLLERLRKDPAAIEIVAAFETAGASQLQLTDQQMATLEEILSAWLEEVGVTHLPPGIFKLRNAVIDHQHDRAGGP